MAESNNGENNNNAEMSSTQRQVQQYDIRNCSIENKLEKKNTFPVVAVVS